MSSNIPFVHSSDSSAVHSSAKVKEKICFCGTPARVRVSWTLKNPGKRFLTCPQIKDINGCGFFEWFDPDFHGRARDVIMDLNHRRIYLEEKLKLVEERLGVEVEKKKMLKVLNKRLCIVLKICGVLLVILIAMFFGRHEKTAASWLYLN